MGLKFEKEATKKQKRCVLVNFEDNSYIQFQLDAFSRSVFLENFCAMEDELS